MKIVLKYVQIQYDCNGKIQQGRTGIYMLTY